MKKRKEFIAVFFCCTMILTSLAGCRDNTQQTPENQQEVTEPADTKTISYINGTYEGTGIGNSGDIKVSVTVTESEITDIKILEEDETYYIFMYPKTEIPKRIIENQSLAVDTISGATFSSNGIIMAVKNALEQATDNKDALYNATENVKKEIETIDCEVLVIGSGISGLSAANRLKQNGINVLLIEQLDYVGGSARFSTGAFIMADSAETSKSIKNYLSTRYYFDDFPIAEGTPDVDRVNKNVDATFDAFNMFSDLGVGLTLASKDLNAYIINIPESLKEAYGTEQNVNTFGSWAVESLASAYLKQGGNLMLHTKATSLITDNNGAVIGASAEGKDKDYVINAQNVVLATGSYSHNDELLRENIPWREGDLSATSIGNDGSGIIMAREAGAVMTEYNYINGGARVANPIDALRTKDGNWNSSDVISSIAMIVSSDGKRLASEQDDRYFRYYPITGGQDKFFSIYDSTQLQSVDKLESYDALVHDDGPYYKADTLEELAQKCGFDYGNFEKSISSFNHYCETGEDIFDESLIDKNSFSQDKHEGASGNIETEADTKLPIKNGPFYATKLTFVSYDIIGGIKTGGNGEVLNANGEAIPGLYGVGFISSRDFLGSGTAHGYCLMIGISTGMITADTIINK